MQTAAFEDEAPELRELYAQSFNHLLMDYLDDLETHEFR
jgi:hypothetical protein